MIHPASTRSIERLADPSPAFPAGSGAGDRTRSVVETGAIVARIFDLLDGTCLEPFAAQIARGLVNGARHTRQH